MVIVFDGGPIHGEFKHISNDTQELRVGCIDGTVALYHIGKTDEVEGVGTLGAFHYSGDIVSAESLISLWEKDFHHEG
jgi:hypothetical protein